MEKVFQYIDDHKEMYVEWLQDLCRQPSVSAQNRGIRKTAKLVEELLTSIGAKAEQIPTSGNPVVFGEINQNKEHTLSFYNHYDVQPEDPIEEWEYEPFAAEIHDGKIFARGVADNKGSFLSRICAVHAYQQVYGELPLNIKFIVDGEEEVGSVNTHEFAEKYPEKNKSDGCIWENGYKNTDGSLQVRFGLKGMLYVELRAKGANIDLHSSNAAIIKNPAWRLVWALNTLKNEEEKVLIDGFYDNVLQPTEAEYKYLEKMGYQEQDQLDALELDSFLLNLSGTPLKEKLIFQPTCTICGIDSGYTGEGSKTVLPSFAKAKIDFRLVPGQDPDEILQYLRNHLDRHGFQDIEIVKISGKRAAKTDPESVLAQTVVDNVEKIYGKEPQVMLMSPGTGPMYKLCQEHGIPAVGVGVGYYNSQVHAPNENIRIADYVDGIKFIATIIEQFAKNLKQNKQ